MVATKSIKLNSIGAPHNSIYTGNCKRFRSNSECKRRIVIIVPNKFADAVERCAANNSIAENRFPLGLILPMHYIVPTSIGNGVVHDSNVGRVGTGNVIQPVIPIRINLTNQMKLGVTIKPFERWVNIGKAGFVMIFVGG